MFFLVFKNFFTNPVVTENVRLQLSRITLTVARITVANDTIEMLPVATDKTVNHLSKYSKEANYLLRFLFTTSLSLISATKVFNFH